MKDELLQRLHDLKEVAAWSLENGGLGPGQRICLHQERAGCYKQLAALDNDSPYQDIPGYKMPPNLQEKTTHILRVIRDTGWEKQVINY